MDKLKVISHRPIGSMIPRIEHEMILDEHKQDAFVAMIVIAHIAFYGGLFVYWMFDKC